MSESSNSEQTAPVLEPGYEFSHFRLEERLGEGGMGVVFRARDLTLDRAVAVKFLRPGSAHKFSARVLEELRKRFVQEAKLLARVDHPYLVSIFQADFDENIPYLVMECATGQSLKERYKQEPPVTVAQACHVGACIANALGYAYERFGVIHRDLKPSNVVLHDEGGVKILDLGLAKVVTGETMPGASITQQGRAVGTPKYMAPEQFRPVQPLDHRVDMYALGVTLYEVLARRLPFIGRTAQDIFLAKVSGEFPRLDRYVPDVPDSLAQLLRQLLAPEPDDRPESYLSIEKVLNRVAAEAGGAAEGVLRETFDTDTARVDVGAVQAAARTQAAARAQAAARTQAATDTPAAAAKEPSATAPQGPKIRLGRPERKPTDAAPVEDASDRTRAVSALLLPASERLLRRIHEGMRVAEYEVGSRIGIGGMGIVHRAVNTHTDEHVALKFLIWGEDESPEQRLENTYEEVRRISSLEHSSIVKVREARCADDLPFMIMELFLGPYDEPVNLDDYSKGYGPATGLLDEGDLRQICSALLSAVGYAHDNGVVHCDLKPGNVLFQYEGAERDRWSAALKLTDFGVARVVGEHVVQSSIHQSMTRRSGGQSVTEDARALLTTYEYMSPEQRRGESATPASDVYAVGMMLFRFLTGRAEPGLERPSSLRDNIDPGWDDIIRTALQQDPGKRFGSARDMLGAIRAL